MYGGQRALAATARPSAGGWRTRLRAWSAERFGSEDYRAAGRLRPTFLRVVNEDLRALLPAIQAPTLLIWGDEDRETPLAQGQLMAQAIPRMPGWRYSPVQDTIRISIIRPISAPWCDLF